MGLPAAILYVNEGLRDSVEDCLVKQLFITQTMLGGEFNAIIAADPNYPDYVRTHGQRVMVLWDFSDPMMNKFYADVIIYCFYGMASIEKNLFIHCPNRFLKYRIAEITWPKLSIFGTNFALVSGSIMAGQNLKQTLYYGPNTGPQGIIVDVDGYISGPGTIDIQNLIAPVFGPCLDGYLPAPSVVGIKDSNDEFLSFGQIPDGCFVQRVGGQLVGAPIGSFNTPNLTALAGIPNSQIGTLAWVSTLECLFVATPDGLGIVDGIELMQGLGVRWQRLVGSSSVSWLSQVSWYIDSSNGNDENPGDITAPLKSADEIQRRWGTNPLLKQSVTIYVVNSVDLLQLYARTASKNVTITVQGIVTAAYTSTISAISDIDPANNYGVHLSVAGITDWSLFQNDRVSFTGNNSNTWISKINPESLGISVARVSVPYYFNNIPVREIPNTGSTGAIIHSLPTVNHLNINLQAATNEALPNSYQAVIIDSIYCDGSFSIHSGESYAQAVITGCSLNCAIDVSSDKDVAKFVGCKIIPPSGTFPEGNYYGCLVNGATINLQSQYLTEVLFEGSNVSVLGGTFANMTQCQIFDAVGDGLDVLAGAIASVTSGLSGKGNTGIGLNISNGGELIYDIRPFITGTGGEVKFGGTVTTWSTCSTPTGILPNIYGSFLSLFGGTMAGAIDMSDNHINNVPMPVLSKQPLTLEYLEDGYISQDQLGLPFSISSFTANTSTTHYRGDTISGMTIAATYISGPPVSASLLNSYAGSISGSDIDPGSWTINSPYASGSQAGSIKRSGTDLGVDPTVTVTLTVHSPFVTKTSAITITFCDLIYWGVGNAGPITPTGIQTLPNNTLNPSHVSSMTLSPNAQKVFYCFPARLSTPTFSLNGFPVSFLSSYSVGPLVNVNSVTATYTVLETTQLLTGTNLQFIRTS